MPNVRLVHAEGVPRDRALLGRRELPALLEERAELLGLVRLGLQERHQPQLHGHVVSSDCVRCRDGVVRTHPALRVVPLAHLGQSPPGVRGVAGGGIGRAARRRGAGRRWRAPRGRRGRPRDPAGWRAGRRAAAARRRRRAGTRPAARAARRPTGRASAPPRWRSSTAVSARPRVRPGRRHPGVDRRGRQLAQQQVGRAVGQRGRRVHVHPREARRRHRRERVDLRSERPQRREELRGLRLRAEQRDLDRREGPSAQLRRGAPAAAAG